MASDEHKWLLQLTSLPTAAGCEHRVERWVQAWLATRQGLSLTRDGAGNITITRDGAVSDRPVYLTAHMDHPAFVVIEQIDKRRVLAEFRGGVGESYFQDAAVRLRQGDGDGVGDSPRGIVSLIDPDDKPKDVNETDGSRLVNIKFDVPVSAAAGDVITWDMPDASISEGRLRAPVCDDLAALAAALAAFDRVIASSALSAADDTKQLDVRLLLTRAEEVGFIGAIAACREKSIPHDALLVCLENSKAFTEAPIGDGPIVRVGDRTSTFDPDLTYRVGKIAEGLAADDATFRFQRKLMVGGTCEASAFQAFGYTATCVCLPLGNYHNMNEETGAIDSEVISVADFDHMVTLLAAVAKGLSAADPNQGLAPRLDELFEKRCGVLGESC